MVIELAEMLKMPVVGNNEISACNQRAINKLVIAFRQAQ
jgi:hypothetical protein